MELGIISLSDIKTDPVTGRPFPYGQRLDEIVGYLTLADRRGLDVFAGAHHSSLLPQTSVLTPHERGLLHEWLDRIASS